MTNEGGTQGRDKLFSGSRLEIREPGSSIDLLEYH